MDKKNFGKTCLICGTPFTEEEVEQLKDCAGLVDENGEETGVYICVSCLLKSPDLLEEIDPEKMEDHKAWIKREKEKQVYKKATR